jgi:hypothetical protein
MVGKIKMEIKNSSLNEQPLTENRYLYNKNKKVDMNLAVKKVELIEWLTKVQDKSVIEKVENLKNQSIKNSYEAKLKPMSSKAYKAMLEKSEDDYKQGRVISQKALEKESASW